MVIAGFGKRWVRGHGVEFLVSSIPSPLALDPSWRPAFNWVHHGAPGPSSSSPGSMRPQPCSIITRCGMACSGECCPPEPLLMRRGRRSRRRSAAVLQAIHGRQDRAGASRCGRGWSAAWLGVAISVLFGVPRPGVLKSSSAASAGTRGGAAVRARPRGDWSGSTR